jgi:hypothetical protein
MTMWANDIPKSRTLGLTRCSCISSKDLSLHSALALFGLGQDESSLVEVSPENGMRVLERLLTTSLVDDMQAMPRDLARLLVGEFIGTFRGQGCRFYTNGNWGTSDPPSWNPLTSAVFDGGLIAFGPVLSACVWVEEND